MGNIIELDQNIFVLFNQFHNLVLDDIMRIITYRFTWIPFYGFLIYIIIKECKNKSYIILPFIAALIFASDRISSGIIKPYFHRLRPCYEPKIQHLVHIVDGCGGEFGFISSHATNCFAIAMFLFLLLEGNKYIKWMFAWAFVVSYSRIYMGVHYPADILCGSILGVVLGYLFYQICIATIRLFPKVCKE